MQGVGEREDGPEDEPEEAEEADTTIAGVGDTSASSEDSTTGSN